MNDKEIFIKESFLSLLQKLPAAQKGSWGVMNAQEMVEHMSYAFRMANGKDTYELITPLENIEKMQAFVLSDRNFKPNTKNALLSDSPVPAQKGTMHESIAELKNEIEAFFTLFEMNPTALLLNPFFGALNYEKWLALLYKHCQHHAKQFELI